MNRIISESAWQVPFLQCKADEGQEHCSDAFAILTIPQMLSLSIAFYYSFDSCLAGGRQISARYQTYRAISRNSRLALKLDSRTQDS